MRPIFNNTFMHVQSGFIVLFTFANYLILCTIISYVFKWLFNIEFPILLLFGLFLVKDVAVMYVRPPFTELLLYRPEFINFPSLYTGRGDANTCLHSLRLLRQETLSDPTNKNCSCTFGCCTVILRLEPSVDTIWIDRFIDQLTESVARPHFMGAQEISIGHKPDAYASLLCKNSWDGIAQWIVKRHFSNSTQNESAPSEITPRNSTQDESAPSEITPLISSHNHEV